MKKNRHLLIMKKKVYMKSIFPSVLDACFIKADDFPIDWAKSRETEIGVQIITRGTRRDSNSPYFTRVKAIKEVCYETVVYAAEVGYNQTMVHKTTRQYYCHSNANAYDDVDESTSLAMTMDRSKLNAWNRYYWLSRRMHPPRPIIYNFSRERIFFILINFLSQYFCCFFLF